ncbi:putative metal-binding protein [Archaeoglobus sulfaticallidus PM70-1]|uniref:Putative metal-binding protein n=1 Tax=Archaeoglobus sulfaticallidus PM70-1 TaxID=387631 RepID=N0BLG5_9EURY|nr:SWIM zinc finger family protein [Archaeoglobus sulfaticallidus]AGK61025.1 putative metal-binding protein [Archaeoglobus sulfaticallidus PM70-1]
MAEMVKEFEIRKDVIETAKKGIDFELYKKLLFEYGKRGEKAFIYLKEDRVKKYRDFFIVVGENEYIVEENFCTCEDFQINLKGKKPCSHIIAMLIARKIGHYRKFDKYYTDYLEKR